MTNIAILYTGETRTIEKTIEFFKQNILSGSQNIHVFAVLQGDVKIETWFREKMGNHLKSLEWFERNDIVWKSIQKRLIDNIVIEQNWKTYLENSGSMIEYYQLFLAYSSMVKHENNTNIQYDFIMRMRPDVIINKPIDFSIFTQNSVNYKNLMECIQLHYGKQIGSDITKNDVFILMNSLLDNNRYKYITYTHGNSIMENNYYNNSEINDLCKDFSYDALAKYIQHGKYVISLRKNVVYLANRKHFVNIASLGIMYGMQRMADFEIWFNAESQFETSCLNNGLAIFNSTTSLEDKSLYEYNSANYFEEEELVKQGSTFLFFICRK